MDFIDIVLLFKIMVCFYLLGTAAPLLLHKHPRASNIFSNYSCIIASLTGIAASLIQIIRGSGILHLIDMPFSLPNLSVSLQMDNLSAFFLLALSILVLSVSIYSLGYISHYFGKRNVGLFNALYAGFILSMILVITAKQAMFFFIAWEIMSLLSYFLVAFEDEQQENQTAATLYIVMMHVAAGFLLAAFMIMFTYTGSFDIFGNSALIPSLAKNIMFVFFFIGFGTKAGLIPFHIWLPYAHPAAPSNVSALMSGIMLKTAIYGMLRFTCGYLGVQSSWWGVLLLSAGLISCVLGVAYAMMEHNIKRLLAFHSIENIGIIAIGMGVSFIALAYHNLWLAGLAMAALLLHTFNHTLFKGGLFLGAGAIQFSTHTKDIEKLGGLIKKIPLTALFVLCFSLAISAIVPFNGFVSEWLTYQALFANITTGNSGINILSMVSIAGLALAGALAAGCFIKLFGIAFLGRPRSDHAVHAGPVPVSMNVGMGLLAFLCLLIGLFPLLFLQVVDRVVYALLGQSILPNLQGGFCIAYYPMQIAGNAIQPFMIFILILAVIILMAGLLVLMGGRHKTRSYGTWDCGFERLNSRMQYSATGFSKPVRIVFSILYRPSRDLELIEGQSAHFSQSINYTVSTEAVFEKYLYHPALDIMRGISRTAKLSIQTGSIHIYLLYIMLTLLALMLYNSFSR